MSASARASACFCLFWIVFFCFCCARDSREMIESQSKFAGIALKSTIFFSFIRCLGACVIARQTDTQNGWERSRDKRFGQHFHEMDCDSDK